MEKMLVTQALDERDMLAKRINDSIARTQFVAVKKPNDELIYDTRQKITDYEEELRSDMQSITDLISRYKRLDAAILLANATTYIEVAGIKMTRAAAINLRKNMKGFSGNNANSNFEEHLINKMKQDLNYAQGLIGDSQMTADRQKEMMTNSLASNEKKVLSEDSLNSILAYCNNLVFSLVDPVDITKKIVDMQKEQDELMAGLESAIKVSNATTFVEF